MEENNGSFWVVWFSGFFGLGALVHLLRLVFQVPVTIGTFEIPLTVSLVVGAIFSILSIGLFLVGKR